MSQVITVGRTGINNLAYSKIMVSRNSKDHIGFQIFSEDGEKYPGGQTTVHASEILEECESLLEDVDDVASKKGNSPDTVQDILWRGKGLYDEVFPEYTKKYFNTLPSNALIEFNFDDIDIPIEYFSSNGNEFFARQYRVTRLAAKEEPVVSENYQREATCLLFPIAGVGPNNGLVNDLKSFLNKRNYGEMPKVESITSLGAQWGSYKLVWVTSHGVVDKKGPALKLFRNYSLRPHTLRRMSPLAVDAFVIANACRGGVVRQWFTTRNDFGQAFYSKGASVFVAPSTLIPLDYARQFGEELIIEARPGANILDVMFKFRETSNSGSKIMEEEEKLFRSSYRITTNLNFRLTHTVPSLSYSGNFSEQTVGGVK